jgi:hypothetical protein
VARSVLLLDSMRWLDWFSKLAVVGAALCIITVAQEAREGNKAQPDFPSIIQHLEQAERQAKPQVSYQVVREYRLFNTGSSSAASEVLAQVDYLPPDQKTYSIQQRTGSSRGEQAVRKILDHESACAAGGPEAGSAAITRANYNFTNLGESTLDGKSFYLLGLEPKRKQRELIEGQAWVDKHTFLIRRVEGQLAKSPSWWLKGVHVKLDFSEVSGLWLQTGMEATADVRFVGSQTLQAKTVDSRTTDVVAARRAPQSVRKVRREIPAELLFPAVTPRQ